jgi:predicted amidohydrolase
MNVHLVRLDIAREDPAANRARVGQLVDRASPAAGDRALLPETAFTSFRLDSSRTMSDARAAEDFLAPLARR